MARHVTMNHRGVVKIAARRRAAGKPVKSSRKLKSFRENYDGHGKPRCTNVKTCVPFATNYKRNVEVWTVPI